ncbi:hypothetical protein K9L67_00300 [Candidatus Woesearchaeota archaeon]|nr:hypothetical protein [Candidatus Woesearchaeota archaeon]MCF7900647.1 hypothetical protein [Candidatus Woesearchaeota archaeon]
MPDIQRQTAKKMSIKQILESKYVQQQGWEPNYLELQGIKAGRVNILAAIVAKENNTITIDDGTGQINLIMFSEKEKADNLDVADVIMTIGKPREYNTQRYIVPEIMRKIQNKKWIMYRRKELETIQNNPEQETEKKVEPKKEIQIQEKKIELPEPRNEKENITQKIIRLIKQKDKGDGANIEEVLQEANDKDAEKNLNILINEGEIFEVRAGKVKVLD